MSNRRTTSSGAPDGGARRSGAQSGGGSTRGTDPSTHHEIPLFATEQWMYEDFVVGEKIRSIRRTISEGESMTFNSLVHDLHPYVADEVFAKEEGLFGRRLVAGAFVFSLGLGLVAHNNIHTFSYGYDRLRFIAPVFIGDTIYTIRTNMEKQPKYEEMGLVRVSYEVFKNKGELVLYCEHLQTVKYRNSEQWQDRVQKRRPEEGGSPDPGKHDGEKDDARKGEGDDE